MAPAFHSSMYVMGYVIVLTALMNCSPFAKVRFDIYLDENEENYAE